MELILTTFDSVIAISPEKNERNLSMSFFDKIENWITRRNFLKGVGVSLAAALFISGLSGCEGDSDSDTTIKITMRRSEATCLNRTP